MAPVRKCTQGQGPRMPASHTGTRPLGPLPVQLPANGLGKAADSLSLGVPAT